MVQAPVNRALGQSRLRGTVELGYCRAADRPLAREVLYHFINHDAKLIKLLAIYKDYCRKFARGHILDRFMAPRVILGTSILEFPQGIAIGIGSGRGVVMADRC